MEFEYLEESGKNYLIYNKKENQEIDYVTLGMIENNEIDGTLRFYCRQIDNNIQFRYDISGLRSINELFCGKTNRVQMISFLKAIEDVYLSCEKYMIDITQIMLNPKYIFATDNWKKIKFVLLPLVCSNEKFDKQLRDMILNLEFDRKEDCSYVVELLNYFQHNEVFSIKEFSTMIRTIENSNIGYIQKNRNLYQSEAIIQQMGASQPEKQGSVMKVGGMKISQASQVKSYQEPMSGYHIQEVQYGNSKPESHIANSESKKEKNKKGLFSFGKKNDKAIEKYQKNLKKQTFGNIAIPGIEDGGYSKGSVVIPNTQIIKAQNVQMQSYYAYQEDFGETILLDENQQLINKAESAKKNFELMRTSTEERYAIDKPLMKIGRKKSLVDICVTGNTHVGRIHAIIYIKEGKLFIEDNDSRNGVFLNGKHEKITEMVELQTGDKILLGDEELIVL